MICDRLSQTEFTLVVKNAMGMDNMSGVTKHIFEHEIRDIISMWTSQLKEVQSILPLKYDYNDIINLLKRFYPHEWKSVEIKYSYYNKKDIFLKKRFGKARYGMQKPEILIKKVPFCKKLMSPEFKENWYNQYTVATHDEAEKALWSKRSPKIQRIDQKINVALEKTQQVTPSFLNKLIGLYERKNTSQKDKLYILQELKKYYSVHIIEFFFKLNDTELNKQLRYEAFYHLQSFNYQPRLRRQKYMQIHTKNAKRKAFLKNEYPNLKYCIPQNPQELEYRINNSKEQQIKEYDYFISHSSKDHVSVQELINAENKMGKNIFCDWINDVDYLKRHLMCESTLRVIERRLEQSKALIFVESENSLNSVWCKYELNYFAELHRPMYVIKQHSIDEKEFSLAPLNSSWFSDTDYKALALSNGLLI